MQKRRNGLPARWPEFTREWAMQILREYVGAVCATRMIPEGSVTRYKVDGLTVHVIYLRNNFPWEIGTDRFYETVVHELIHIFCHVHGIRAREDDVERACVEFHTANKAFAKELYEAIASGTRYLVWDPPLHSSLTQRDRLMAIKEMIRANRK